MSFPLFNLISRVRVRYSFLGLAVVLFFAALGIGAASRINLTKTTTFARAPFGAPLEVTPPAVRVLSIQLKRGGFVPRDINVPAGDYFISFTNMSGVPDITLRVDRENGGRLHEVTIQKEKPSWRRNIHLNAGTYLLTEANHPQWVCRITVAEP